MAKRKVKIAARMQVVRAALVAARPIIAHFRRVEIEGCANSECAPRRGSIKDSVLNGVWHHPDTVTEPGAVEDMRRCDRALNKIDAALKVVRP